MAKFDKYILSQLIVLFGFFSLVLVLVYWVNRAVALFDQLIANGHSALVFLEFSALTLPNVIRLVLPMAAFAASIYCANRLASDSELVVVQSTGYSPFRLARPVLIFGIIVALMLSVLTHVLVPASLTQLEIRKTEIESSATARLLREGTFLHPAPGVTFYIRDIGPDGTMMNLFLSDSRNPEHQTSYSARSALLVKGELGPKLVMFDGMAQDLQTQNQLLSTTSFSEFVFDIGPLVASSVLSPLRPKEMATVDLLWPTETTIKATRTSRAVLLQIGHERISQALLSIVLALVGFSAILMGGFSRFSLWKQITVALLVMLVLKTLDNLLNDVARKDDLLWPLIYVSSLVGFAIAFAMLWYSTRPALFLRRTIRGTT